MHKNQGVSLSVIKRLPRYYRFLGDLMKAGTLRISSSQLSEIMGLTASQIRQDLNCFGGFGQQGYGYNVELLYNEIGKILGLDRQLNAVLIGAGNLGRAIATHMSFETKGFTLAAIFDQSETLIGTSLKDIKIQDIARLDEVCRQIRPEVAILCIPKGAAQELADHLVGLGIRGFWNFSHFDLSLNFENIVVENVHLGDSLMTLSYCVNDMLRKDEE